MRQEWNPRPLVRRGLSSLLAQGAEKQDELPALFFRQAAEGGHAAPWIAIGNLPEEGSVAERLHERKVQVCGILFSNAAAVLLVAFRTLAVEKFFSTRR